MKRLLLIACILNCTLLSQAKDWTQYVNPLMGSQSTFELSTGNAAQTRSYIALQHDSPCDSDLSKIRVASIKKPCFSARKSRALVRFALTTCLWLFSAA